MQDLNQLQTYEKIKIRAKFTNDSFKVNLNTFFTMAASFDLNNRHLHQISFFFIGVHCFHFHWMENILVSMKFQPLLSLCCFLSSFNPLKAYHWTFLLDNNFCCHSNQKFDFDHSFVSVLLAVHSFQHIGLRLKHSVHFQSLCTENSQ